MLYLWTQNYPQIVGTCPGHHGQLISQNCVFTKIRGEPPPPPPPPQFDTDHKINVGVSYIVNIIKSNIVDIIMSNIVGIIMNDNVDNIMNYVVDMYDIY